MLWPAERASVLPVDLPVELLIAVGMVISVPFGPAEPLTVGAGALSVGPETPLWGVVLAAATGMTCGDLLVAGLARRLRAGPPATDDPPRSPPRRVDRAAAVLARRAAESRLALLMVAGARFVPGLRTPTAVAVGLAGLPIRRCAPAVAAGSLTWAGVYSGIGRLAAETLDGTLDGRLDSTVHGGLAVVAPSVLLGVGAVVPVARALGRRRPHSIRTPAPWRADPSTHS